MRRLSSLFLSLFIVLIVFAGQARADEDESMGLFVNLNTMETGAAGHALHFSGKMMKRGHPVTFFLNEKAVLFASKSTPLGNFGMSKKTIREMLSGLVDKGAKVIVCQVCARMNGVSESDLIDGAQLGNPDLVSSYLFDPKYQVISW